MIAMRTLTITVALSAVIALMGCSPLAPRPDNSKFFILTPVSDAPIPGAAMASTVGGSRLAVGVGPIDFPGYLRRLSVVTVTSENEIDLSSENYWGEPLEKNFTRVLMENLARMLNTPDIERYPWAHNVHIDYQVTVDVQRFDTNAQGQSQLVARWSIKEGATGKDLYASETAASTQVGPGAAGPSAALSQDMAILSREIAARVADLSAHRTQAHS